MTLPFWGARVQLSLYSAADSATPLAVIVPFLQLEFVPLIVVGRGLLCNREYKRRPSRGGQKTSRNNAGRRHDDDKGRAAKKAAFPEVENTWGSCENSLMP